MENPSLISYTPGVYGAYGAMRPCLINVAFYRADEGSVTLVAESARTLERLKFIPPVTISADKFENRPFDAYDKMVELVWAFSLLGICSDFKR